MPAICSALTATTEVATSAPSTIAVIKILAKPGLKTPAEPDVTTDDNDTLPPKTA